MLKEETIEDWLTQAVAELLQCDPDSVDVERPFQDHGLGSRDLVSLTGDLSKWLNIELEPTLLFEHTCISKLASHLAQHQ